MSDPIIATISVIINRESLFNTNENLPDGEVGHTFHFIEHPFEHDYHVGPVCLNMYAEHLKRHCQVFPEDNTVCIAMWTVSDELCVCLIIDKAYRNHLLDQLVFGILDIPEHLKAEIVKYNANRK